jgi:hypothetical protein
MKKVIIFAVVILAGISEIHAQDTQDTLRMKIRTGFFFVPQGVFQTTEVKNAFSVVTPLFAVFSFNRGHFTVNVMYNMLGNNIQAVYACQFSKIFGTYLVSNKNVLTEGGYSGIGITMDVKEGKATAFCEVGSCWEPLKPIIYIGVIIPFMVRIK